MKLAEQIKLSWPFLMAVVIYVLLVVISTSGIGSVSDFFFGISYILMAVTLTYTCIKAGKRMQEKGKYWRGIPIIYGSGFLSGIWLYEAVKCFF